MGLKHFCGCCSSVEESTHYSRRIFHLWNEQYNPRMSWVGRDPLGTSNSSSCTGQPQECHDVPVPFPSISPSSAINRIGSFSALMMSQRTAQITWIFQVLLAVVSYEVPVPAKYTTAITSVSFPDSKMSSLVWIHQLQHCQNTNVENSFAEVLRNSPWLQCPSVLLPILFGCTISSGLAPVIKLLYEILTEQNVLLFFPLLLPR